MHIKMPSDGIKRSKLGFLIILVFTLGLFSGIALDQLFPYVLGSITSSADLRLVWEAWRIIRSDYVDRGAAQPRVMAYGAISGMVDALGDTGHSRFLSPQMVRALEELKRNKFEGVGAEIRIKAGHVVVVAPMDNSPAQRAGVRAGDIILRVNGKEVTGLPLDQVVAQISGPVGSSVSLTILNPLSGRTREVVLVRASITVHSVSWQQIPGTKLAHLRISSFGKGMTAELHAALEKINSLGMNGIVLDLRNNPGGLLNEAIGAASQFLNQGEVLLTKDARGNVKPVPITRGGIACNIPMAVLINGGTASAAEIVAGALRAAHRAKLIGAPTFGTGTVLNEFPLSDGSAILLAVEEWLTPSGQTIWHKGISPDIAVSLPPDVPLVLPEEERDMTVAAFRDRKDTQLLSAVALFRKPGIAMATKLGSIQVSAPGS
jgi:carboxyl-terminal processing protease